MKRGLQIVLGVISLIPLYFAVTGMLGGAEPVGGEAVPGAVDNQFRYLSGIYLLVTLSLWRVIRNVEGEGTTLALALFAMAIGGVGRVISLMMVGDAAPEQTLFTPLEIGAPLLLIWQRMVAKSGA